MPRCTDSRKCRPDNSAATVDNVGQFDPEVPSSGSGLRVLNLLSGVIFLGAGQCFDVQKDRSGPGLAEDVVGIAERTVLHGETTAADATAQLISQRRKAGDPFVKLAFPGLRQLLPILGSEGAVVGQHGEGIADFGQRHARLLGNLDDGNPPQYRPRIAPLIAAIAAALDQALLLIEMERRDGNAASAGHVSDGKLELDPFIEIFLHCNP